MSYFNNGQRQNFMRSCGMGWVGIDEQNFGDSFLHMVV